MIMAERAGSARNRAIILTLLSTGLRNTALRALRVGDVIKEIQSGQENLVIKIEAEWNTLRIPGAVKGAIPYYTFTSAKATEAIKEMLKRRAEKFAPILEDEPLFLAGGTQQSKKKHLSNTELRNIVKCAAIEAGIKKWRYVSPHTLRKVFESVLRSPTIDGGRMDPKDQEFLMGHILPGTQDAYYDWTKISKLRAQFAKLVFEDKLTPEQQKLSMHKNVAKILEIDVDLLKSKKEKVLGRGLLVKEEFELIERAIKKKTSPLRNEKEQKIVPKNELETYLSKGWKYVVSVDEKLAIVEKPLSDFDEDTGSASF
jgi:hypothetical protein